MGNAIAIPQGGHQNYSKTYGDKNSPSRIKDDAADLPIGGMKMSGDKLITLLGLTSDDEKIKQFLDEWCHPSVNSSRAESPAGMPITAAMTGRSAQTGPRSRPLGRTCFARSGIAIVVAFSAANLGCASDDAGGRHVDAGVVLGDAGGRDAAVDAGVVLGDAGGRDAAVDSGSSVNPRALFVSPSGNDARSGRTPSTAFRTIAHAAAVVSAGETIYAKAGNYGPETIVFAAQGTMTEPIVLEGYRDTPGDRPTLPSFSHRSSVDAGSMPLLDGGDRANGTAIELHNRTFVTVRNLQIMNYRNGIYAYAAHHVTVEEVYLATFGENDQASYTGNGIIFGSGATHCLARGSVVVNAGAEALMLYGDDNRIDGCRVYASNNGGTNMNDTDYYIMAAGNRNVIENSRVERVGDLWHTGHGIGLKGNCTENIIRNNLAVGFEGASFYARHRGVTHNQFLDNEARDGTFGMVFRDGTSNNVVDGHTTENVRIGVAFLDTTEDEGRQFTGDDNIVRNSTFRHLGNSVINLHDYTFDDVYARRNVFENITVEDAAFLFEVRSFGADNILRNSTLSNVREFANFVGDRTVADLGFSFSGNTQQDNGFTLP